MAQRRIQSSCDRFLFVPTTGLARIAALIPPTLLEWDPTVRPTVTLNAKSKENVRTGRGGRFVGDVVAKADDGRPRHASCTRFGQVPEVVHVQRHHGRLGLT